MTRSSNTRSVLIALVVLLSPLATPVGAQSPLRQGERVRAMLPDGLRVVGTVTEVGTVSFGLTPDGNVAAMNLAFNEIQGLERSIGQTHQGAKWATYGAIAGGGLGILSGLTWFRWGGSTGLAAAAYVGVVNAAWWGGAGYAAGYFLGKRDIWQTVQIGGSERRGIGLVLGTAPALGNAGVSPVLVGISISIP